MTAVKPPPRAAWHLLVLVPLAATAWVYHPITRVFFFADDFVHLTEIVNESLPVFLLRPFGGQAFLTRNLIFWASYQAFGPDPVWFQWTVLLAHLVNVWLLFGVLRTLTASATLACLGATLWGTSPLNVGSLGWYAAFGHVLVGTTLLLVLHLVTRDGAGGPVRTRTAAAACALLLVGSTCYGPGMGVALASPVTLFLLLPAAWRQRGVRVAFLALPAATLAIYVWLRVLYPVLGQPLPPEELFQQRVALSGFEHIPPLAGHLLMYSVAGTLLGFFMPADYPHPDATVTVVVFAAGVGFTLWRGDSATRRLVVAMLALWGGLYVMIAAGRAHMFAVFKTAPTEAAMSGRYHYAGLVPLVVVLCVVLRQLGALPVLRRAPASLALATGVALWFSGYLGSDFRIDERQNCQDYFARTQREIADAVRAAPAGAPVTLENGTSPWYVLGMLIPNRLFPGRGAAFLIAHPSGTLDGHELRFVERDPRVRAEYEDRPETPLGRLLVYP
jgi:hypothetical protein